MTHSEHFEMIKEKYDTGRWGVKVVRALVAAGRLYDWEFEEITGEAYNP